MLKYVEGDLIEMAKKGNFDVIVHGCNCQNVMGAGIALQIARDFPTVYLMDKIKYRQGKTNPGETSSVELYPYESGKRLKIINAYTQLWPGKAGRPRDTSTARLEMISKAFQKITCLVDFNEKIGIPLIGAGLAGGDWSAISAVISNAMKRHDVTVVKFKTT